MTTSTSELSVASPRATDPKTDIFSIPAAFSSGSCARSCARIRSLFIRLTYRRPLKIASPRLDRHPCATAPRDLSRSYGVSVSDHKDRAPFDGLLLKEPER